MLKLSSILKALPQLFHFSNSCYFRKCFANSVDRLESALYPNYVTDDMLNGDIDQQNWMHYGKDYEKLVKDW